ncbi:MAG TPA: hypothetical protein VNJ02_04025 [Vicinamibacterales bacterium]|nr:hypothetical protein [Vicinamibacterales bacterium]
MRAATLTALFAFGAVSQVAAQEPMRFGVDATAAQLATSKGLAMSYGSVWAGAWNQKYGWGGVEEQLRTAKANGLTPVIQWWYWGDDISPTCVEQGCMDRYQGVRKDKKTWSQLSNELADLVSRVYGANSGAVVVIETEFNKAGIENYEAFDGSSPITQASSTPAARRWSSASATGASRHGAISIVRSPPPTTSASRCSTRRFANRTPTSTVSTCWSTAR